MHLPPARPQRPESPIDANGRTAAQAKGRAGREGCSRFRRRQAGGPVGRMQATVATALAEDPDWKEF
jgi:hypothetical protein